MDIRVENLFKEYDSREVLSDINLEIKRGEFVAVMGPSGSGKSTLLYNIGLLEPVTRGRILFDGQNAARLGDKEQSKIRLSKIGFIFQFYNLMPELNVKENILLPYWIGGKFENNKEKIDALLTELGIVEKKNEKINKLSGGERQRVAIARALFNESEVILADEPTGNLDSKSAFEIMEILKKLNTDKGKTIVLVTHDARMAAYAGRIVNLADGKIV
ncbi:MAG: ABC transporter ATP-binding protein [Clostridiales bacterium]|jgi:putative ABC transport system ATP-binding protein|nr:ABC transporter ATP-binding protein [Clostridiales bacterium]